MVFGRDALTGKVQDVFGANISLKVPNSFMDAVRADSVWEFIFPDRDSNPDMYDTLWDGNYEKWNKLGGALKVHSSMPARQVYKELCESAHTSGDPGVLFIDRVQDWTLGTFIHDSLVPTSTNPCGEQPLSVYNNCLLAAMNWSAYVQNPWTKKVHFDFERFSKDVEVATLFLNAVSDVNESLHPLQAQRDADKFGKRIGLELTALGDTMAMHGLKYGSKEANSLIREISAYALNTQVYTSIDLAKKVGPCQALEDKAARERAATCAFMKQNVDKKIQELIVEHGMRNTAFNTVGPTGSISILLNNCTSGVEPVFRFSYRRETRLTGKIYDFIHMPALLHIQKTPELIGIRSEEVKEALCYVDATEVSVPDRLRVQAVLQEYTDSAISSTVNLHNSATVEDIEQVLEVSQSLGLKGVTVFRDGCKRGVLTEAASAPAPQQTTEPYSDEWPSPVIRELNAVETAERHRVTYGSTKMYIIVSVDEFGNPLEVFTKLPMEAGNDSDGVYDPLLYQEKFSLWEMVTRLLSLCLRAGIPLSEVLKQLDKSSFSLVDAAGILARILRKYYSTDVLEDEEGNPIGDECPQCKKTTYVHMGGCPTCMNCGYSKCG